jgi:hypothetical protein
MIVDCCKVKLIDDVVRRIWVSNSPVVRQIPDALEELTIWSKKFWNIRVAIFAALVIRLGVFKHEVINGILPTISVNCRRQTVAQECLWGEQPQQRSDVTS